MSQEQESDSRDAIARAADVHASAAAELPAMAARAAEAVGGAAHPESARAAREALLALGGASQDEAHRLRGRLDQDDSTKDE